MFIPYSVLDLAPITAGSSAAEAFRRSADLAKHAEKWGYNRYWLAEHHNMPGIASSATSLVIGHVAAATSTIRVGSGGIMLPNHAPLVIAEQFGTLESLFPGRIDLGLGRAPGTDQATMRALRRQNSSNGQDFPDQLEELRGYFRGTNRVHAVPGEGLSVPIWLLGSSGFSAQLAGELGLPFSFASHFSPDQTETALAIYRRCFKPSSVLEKPHVMPGVNVIAANSDAEAERLATSMQQQFLHLIRNQPVALQPPVESMDHLWNEYEQAALARQLGGSIVGGPDKVKKELTAFIEKTKADEIMINAQIFDHSARLRSFEIAAQLFNQ